MSRDPWHIRLFLSITEAEEGERRMQIFIVYYIARINVVVYQSLKMSFDSKRKKDEDIYFKLVFTLNYPNAFCCKGKSFFPFLYSSMVWIFFLFPIFLTYFSFWILSFRFSYSFFFLDSFFSCFLSLFIFLYFF